MFWLAIYDIFVLIVSSFVFPLKYWNKIVEYH